VTNPEHDRFFVMWPMRRDGWHGKANEEVPVVKDGQSDVDNVSQPSDRRWNGVRWNASAQRILSMKPPIAGAGTTGAASRSPPPGIRGGPDGSSLQECRGGTVTQFIQ
jgi:hypothetical protein